MKQVFFQQPRPFSVRIPRSQEIATGLVAAWYPDLRPVLQREATNGTPYFAWQFVYGELGLVRRRTESANVTRSGGNPTRHLWFSSPPSDLAAADAVTPRMAGEPAAKARVKFATRPGRQTP